MGIWIPGGVNDSGSSYVPPEWSSGSNEEIVEALNKHYNDEIDLTQYWSVGDERIVSLSAMSSNSYATDSHAAQTVTLVILNVGGKELVTPINGHTECAFIVGQKNSLKYDYQNSQTGMGELSTSSTSSYGWLGATRRSWLDSTYRDAFPSTIKDIFKQFYDYHNPQYPSAVLSQYFTLPSAYEIFGNEYNRGYDYYASTYPQLEYYKTSSNRIKYNGDDTTDLYWWDNYWTKTNYNSSDFRYFMAVSSSNNDTTNGGIYSNKYGIAPHGVI